MILEYVSDLAHLPKIVHELHTHLGSEGSIILLRGNLASGKTTFVKYFAQELGITDTVSSPTFSILHEYDALLFHYDIYQCGSEGFLKSGLMEKLDLYGYHLIEWAEKDFETLLQHYAIPYSTIDIISKDEQRIYKVNIHAYA